MELEQALKAVIEKGAGALPLREVYRLEKDFGFLQNLLGDTGVKQTLIDCTSEYNSALVELRSKGKPQRPARQHYEKPTARQRYKRMGELVSQAFGKQVLETLQPYLGNVTIGTLHICGSTSVGLRIGKHKEVMQRIVWERVREEWNRQNPQALISTKEACRKTYEQAVKKEGSWMPDGATLPP